MRNKRRSDNCLVFRIWENIYPYWHICTGTLLAIYVAVSWINGVQASQKDIEENKRQIEALRDELPDIKSDVKVVKQRVDDIANFMGVPKRRK